MESDENQQLPVFRESRNRLRMTRTPASVSDARYHEKLLVRIFNEVRNRVPLNLVGTAGHLETWRHIATKLTRGHHHREYERSIMELLDIQSDVQTSAMSSTQYTPDACQLIGSGSTAKLYTLNAANIDYITGTPGGKVAVECAMRSAFMTDENDVGGDIHARVKTFFKSLSIIAQGAYGGIARTTFETEYGDSRKAFVIKLQTPPLTTGSVAEGIHEAFVGLCCINRLAAAVPNFVHTYAAFGCGGAVFPEKTSKRKLLGWCSSEGVYDGKTSPGIYIVEENISINEKAKTLREVVAAKTTRLPEILHYLVQITGAIGYAWRAMQFVHFDLHYENVLLQNVSSYAGKHVVYPLIGGDVGVRLNERGTVPRIFDFGMARVARFGRVFAVPDARRGADSLAVTPRYDLVKLFCFVFGEYIRTHNAAEKNKATEIFCILMPPLLFCPEVAATISRENQKSLAFEFLTTQAKNRFSMPILPEYARAFNHREYILGPMTEAFLALGAGTLATTKTIPDSERLTNPKTFLHELHRATAQMVERPFRNRRLRMDTVVFVDSVIRATSSGNSREIQNLVTNFDAGFAFSKTEEKIATASSYARRARLGARATGDTPGATDALAELAEAAGVISDQYDFMQHAVSMFGGYESVVFEPSVRRKIDHIRETYKDFYATFGRTLVDGARRLKSSRPEIADAISYAVSNRKYTPEQALALKESIMAATAVIASLGMSRAAALDRGA